MIDSLALSLIASVAINLVASLDAVEQRLLTFIVGCTIRCSSLEHQMLKIMRQTCCFVRVVLTSNSHGNISLDTRFYLIYSEIYFQTIVECIDASLQRIAVNSLIVILLLRICRVTDNCQQHRNDENLKIFHFTHYNLLERAK